MSLTIDQNNNVTGTDTNISKPGYTSTDTGSISTNGNMTLTCQYGGVTVATITAAVVAASNTLTSTSGTISEAGGSSTSFSLSLSTNTPLGTTVKTKS